MRRLALMALFALMGCQKTEAPPAPAFDAIQTPAFTRQSVDVSVAPSPYAKHVADINGDGLPDMLIGSADGTQGGLYLYTAPSWTKTQIVSGVTIATDMDACDMDGDGDLDIVAPIENGGLRWWSNPAWTQAHTFGGTSQELHDVEAFDWDFDGDCDLVTRDQPDSTFGSGGDTIYFWEQNTPTSFTLTTLLPASGIPEGEGLASADIDGDGDIDAAVNGVWLENDGGSWTPRVFTSAWDNSYGDGAGSGDGSAYLDIADFNGDGNPDIVIAPSESSDGESYKIAWYEAPDDPTSSTSWTEHIVASPTLTLHHFVGSGDFDLDGDQDIITAQHGGGAAPEIQVYRNDGGGLTWAKTVIDGPGAPTNSEGSHSMQVADLDLDGDLDVMGANWDSPTALYWWRNDTLKETIGLDSWTRHVIDNASTGNRIFVGSADINGDNLPDIAAGAYWYANPGTPAGSWTRTAIGGGLNNYAALYDFDGDGDVDILGTQGTGAETNPNFVYRRNDGSGAFATGTGSIASGTGDADFLQGVTVSRFSPGEAIRVALSWHAQTASSYLELLTVPADPFAGSWTIAQSGVTSQWEGLSHADIDRDLDDDLVMGTTWAENTGGGWTGHTLFTTGDAPDRNVLADINRDGRLDVVIGYEAISIDGTLAWYEQPATATNAWTQHYIRQAFVADSVVGPMSVDVADVDRDGDMDVIVGEHNLSTPANARLIVFENNGSPGTGATWTERVVYTGDEHHDGAQTVDIDRDGDLDIISVGWGHNNVLLYENTSVVVGAGGSGGSGAGGAGGTGTGGAGGTIVGGAGIENDDFNTGATNARWLPPLDFTASCSFGTTASAQLITAPAGTHQLIDFDDTPDFQACALLQDGLTDEDFDIRAKFDGTAPNGASADAEENRGIMAMRADGELAIMLTHIGDGTQRILLAEKYVSYGEFAPGPNNPTTANATAGTLYMRLTRVGNVFNGYTSTDGVSWDPNGEINATAFGVLGGVGFFAGSGWDGSGYVAEVDWFTEESASTGGTGGTGGVGAGGAGGTAAGGTGGTGTAGTGGAGGVVTRPSAGCGLPGSSGRDPGVSTTTVQGQSRTYKTQVPSVYDPNEPLPLIFYWHWLGGSIDSVLNTAPEVNVWDVAGASDGAMFVWPQGLTDWVGGPETGWWLRCNEKDVEFFDVMLAEIAATRCIDLSRVFSTGFSFGADMSTALACCRDASIVRAVAPVAGGFDTDRAPECDTAGGGFPANPPAMRHSYGTLDPIYPLADFQEVGTEMRAALGCAGTTTTAPCRDASATYTEAGTVSCGPEAGNLCSLYDGCDGKFIACEFDQMGHTTPIGWREDTWDYFSSFASTGAGGTGGSGTGGVGGFGGAGGFGGIATGGTGGAPADTTPPAVSVGTFDFHETGQGTSDKTVALPAFVRCFVDATDAESGVQDMSCTFKPQGGGIGRGCVGLAPITGDTWGCDVEFKADAPAGTWVLSHVAVRDASIARNMIRITNAMIGAPTLLVEAP